MKDKQGHRSHSCKMVEITGDPRRGLRGQYCLNRDNSASGIMTPVEKMVTAHPVMFQITQYHTGSLFIDDEIHNTTRHTKLRNIFPKCITGYCLKRSLV